jgi:hypothetical protein
MRKTATFGVLAAAAVGLAGVTRKKKARVPLAQRANPGGGAGRAELKVGEPVVVRFAARIVEGIFDGYSGVNRGLRVRLPNGDGLIVRADDAERKP